MATQARSVKTHHDATKVSENLNLTLKGGGGKSTTVVLKNVSVEVSTPSVAQEKKRLAASKKVANEFSKVSFNAGVNLRLPATAPQYLADPWDSQFVIRKIGKTQTRGRFLKNGQFVEVKK